MDKVNVASLLKKKENKEKISVLTAYDFTFAKIVDTAGIDIILVGDSAANICAGHSDTLPITLEEMIYHAKSVVRGVERAFVVVDLPFGSYQISDEKALESVIRIVKESHASAVKLEGGTEYVPLIQKITQMGIPVMGHLGLCPQSVNMVGDYSVRAKNLKDAEQLKKDAVALQNAGCFSIVLEKIPSPLAKQVSSILKIPTIGIGGGVHCDGQVLVLHDMLGINKDFKPKFVRRFANLYDPILEALQDYHKAVKDSSFPSEKEQYE